MAPVAQADVFVFDWERPSQDYIDDNTTGEFTYKIPDGEVNDRGGVIKHLHTEFDTDTGRFQWLVTFDGQPGTTTFHTTQAFSLVISPGFMPTNAGGQTVEMFYDFSTESGPILSMYEYNGLGNRTSFADGSSQAGTQEPGRLLTSLNDVAGDISQLVAQDNPDGTMVRGFEIDATSINMYDPLYPGDDPWYGLEFGPETMGIWLNVMTNVETVYQDDYLSSLKFARLGWWDGVDQTVVPAPGALALLGLAALAGTRRRRA